MTTPMEPLPLAEPETDRGLGTMVAERPDTSTGDGDHERFAHYVKKDKIVESAVMGTPVKALCGKTWVPSRDPSRFPVCPDCQEIINGLPRGKGGDGGSDGGGS